MNIKSSNPITFNPYSIKFFTETIHLMPRLNLNQQNVSFLTSIFYDTNPIPSYEEKYSKLKEQLKTVNLPDYLKKFDISISSELEKVIQENSDILIQTEIKVDKYRPSIDNVLLTTAYLESLRKKEKVIVTADENGFINTVFYGNEHSENELKNSFNKVMVVKKDGTHQSFISGKEDKSVKIVEEIYSKYKDKKYQIDLNYKTMNSTDLQFTLSYLWGTRTEVGTTGVGCVIYDKNDHLITDGYNALKLEYKDDLLKLMIHNTFLFPKLSGENKDKLIKEIYDLREKITFHGEANALYNVDRLGKKLENATIYLNFHPCKDCADKIKNYGINEIVIDDNYIGNSPLEQKNWVTSIAEATSLLSSKNIALSHYPYSFCDNIEYTVSKDDFIKQAETLMIKDYVDGHDKILKTKSVIKGFIQDYFIGNSENEENSSAIFRKYYNKEGNSATFNEAEFLDDVYKVLTLNIDDTKFIISPDDKKNFTNTLIENYSILTQLPALKEKYPSEITLSHYWNETYGRLLKLKNTLDDLGIQFDKTPEDFSFFYQSFLNQLCKENGIETYKDVENFSTLVQDISKNFHELKIVLADKKKEILSEQNLDSDKLRKDLIHFVSDINTHEYPLINEDILKKITENNGDSFVFEIDKFNRLMAQKVSNLGSDYYDRTKSAVLSNTVLFEQIEHSKKGPSASKKTKVIENKVDIDEIIHGTEGFSKGSKRLFFNSSKHFPKLTNFMKNDLVLYKINVGISDELYGNKTKLKLLELLSSQENYSYVSKEEKEQFLQKCKESGIDEEKLKTLRKEIVLLSVAEIIYNSDKTTFVNTNPLQLQMQFKQTLEIISDYDLKFNELYVSLKNETINKELGIQKKPKSIVDREKINKLEMLLK